jgi:hypothetical protein
MRGSDSVLEEDALAVEPVLLVRVEVFSASREVEPVDSTDEDPEIVFAPEAASRDVSDSFPVGW